MKPPKTSPASSGEASEPEISRFSRIAPIASLGVFAIAAAVFSLRSTDVFWHLAAGRWILEHRRLPTVDPFRFTSGDLEWVDHEWLFQIVMRLVELGGGVTGLQVLRVLLVLLLAGVLFVGVRRTGLSVPAATAISLVALLGTRPRFLLRPELVTFAALALLLLGLREVARRPRLRTALPMFGLVAIWVNFHGEAILAPAVAGLYLCGARLQRQWLDEPSSDASALTWTWVLGLPLALTTALFINPYGPDILTVGLGIRGALSGLAADNLEWMPLWRAPQPFLLAGFLACGLLATFAWRRLGWVHGPTLLAASGLALVATSAVRHQAPFYVAAAFFLAETWSALDRGGALPRFDPRHASQLASTLCLAAALWCVAPPSSGPLQPRSGRFSPGLGIEPGRFPEKAAAFLEEHDEIGPLFNTFAHGGYLLWRLYPARRVFHDGRMELQPGMLKEIAEARSDNRAWDALLRRYGAVGGLVRYDSRQRAVVRFDEGTGTLVRDGESTSNALLFPTETYALVYWDDQAMLFLARSAAHPVAVLAQEYRYVQPEDVTTTVNRAVADPAYRAGVLADVRRKLKQDPGCLRAAAILEQLEESS